MGFMHQSQRVMTPISQVRLTNVAVVRLKKNGQRFEVACYKNKVVNWRNGVETSLDEVLQSQSIFENVSRGKKANNLMAVFGTEDVIEIAKIIIEKGELQVSDGERAAFNESVYQEIATIVAEKCVNPESNRPYPFTVIERAMKEMHYALIPNRSAKQQALEVIKKLKAHMPITRAKMKVQVTVAPADGQATKDFLAEQEAIIMEQRGGDVLRIICQIDPSAYRHLDTFVNPKGKKDASRSLEVLDLSCHEQGEHTIDDEISKKTERLALDLPPAAPAVVAAAAPITEKKAGRPCSTCGGDFPDTAKYREHFRSEWHRYNLKLKSKGRSLVDEATFATIDPADVQKVYDTLE
ncbi:hypothetical protein SPRG_07432 [Saprolegnia parasitica CBS 223.65]|uniref:C2H2-type domain-containing protein n=1 Tax=Saprolegnia parasitica (strain CBS 223.65) TaxID=695850 RepID=A0A067C9P8_SAPPC|nr:hypothetical protein SPRG_07432 [Saprolegnia parasitica CBS 223.65]KDO27183.1 hypothetical protein SPRG_07432 [Saprolegnia parasitica CBS 223.65]|eukprot:XP_012201961.1 hypothetical protein SPRG_07432 [Saprolegnia parasitica CBS 223.65]